ncbi:MAG: HAD-IA family hydrolase [Candidatus Bathyarchaeia archaeon]
MVKSTARNGKNLSLPTPNYIAYQLRDGWLAEAKFEAYEDAEPTLKQLKDSGFQIIAISNVSSKRNLTTYLEKAGLLHYFSVIVASADIGHEKPDPEIFKVASQISKVPLTNMLHVGDKYEEDYLGAQSAGAEAILIDRKGIHKNKECQKISKLTELIDILL